MLYNFIYKNCEVAFPQYVQFLQTFIGINQEMSVIHEYFIWLSFVFFYCFMVMATPSHFPIPGLSTETFLSGSLAIEECQ